MYIIIINLVHDLLYVNRLYTSTKNYLKISWIKLQKMSQKMQQYRHFFRASLCVIYKATMYPLKSNKLNLASSSFMYSNTSLYTNGIFMCDLL